ncbi:MAG: Crp/Fnr family transcriptional regulator, partial [Bradyrhizobium sp.]|uniref:Crp/Fnr family transcriptional regulator n=1 Tax=Bradyrhizobium sp. TaxID=376 RepID=UPI001D44D1CC
MDRSEIERIFTSRGWLAHQPKSLQEIVFRQATVVTFATRDYVYHSGDDAGGIYGIIDGGFGFYLAGREAREALGHVLRAGHWFGYTSVAGRRRITTFRALEPSQALFLPLTSLNEIALRSVEYMRAFAALPAFGAEMAASAGADLLIRRNDQRIAATLLRVTAAEDGVQSSHPDGFHLTQSELAEMANVSRDVMNRTLARFKSLGWIATNYNRVR